MKLKIDPIVAAMLVMMAVLFVLVTYMLVQPAPRYKVLLTNQGCEAFTRLGQKTTKLSEGCEVEGAVDIGWNWVSVGKIRVERSHIIAVQEIQR